MITVILESNDHTELSRVSLPGNERYLIRDEPAFSLLSELSECGYDVFSHADMDRLIRELEEVSEEVGDRERAHIKDLLEMAYRCRDDNTLILTFTPFE